MDDKSYNFRVSKKWARTGLVVLVTAIIVAPLTALAAHQFTDVPDSNIFHNDISWLADAGVTKGCNSAHTEFCPKDVVTRDQMAAFMHRLAINQVVDADKVDGIDAEPLANHQVAMATSSTGAAASTTTDLVSLDVSLDDQCSGATSADNHRLLVTWHGSVNEIDDLNLDFYVAVDGTDIGGIQADIFRATLGVQTSETVSLTTLIQGVPAGDHSVTVRAANLAADSTGVNYQRLIVETRGWECTGAPLGISGGNVAALADGDPETAG
jgi:hypothetical protein